MRRFRRVNYKGEVRRFRRVKGEVRRFRRVKREVRRFRRVKGEGPETVLVWRGEY